MIISMAILGGVAWSLLAVGLLRTAFPAPPEPSYLPVEDFSAIAQDRPLREFAGVERIVNPSLAELVYAALVARVARRQLVVVGGSIWGLRMAATEALTCVQAPIQVLEMAFPGIHWVPSRRVKDPVRVMGVGEDAAPFELPPERRRFIGALLAHTPDHRKETLRALRESGAERAVTPIPLFVADMMPDWSGWCCARRKRKTFGNWVDHALEARGEAYDAEATVDELLEAAAASVRSAGGDVIIDVTIPPTACTSPSMRLPARGSVVEVAELDRGNPPARVIAVALGRPHICALLTRQGLDRDPGVSLYFSQQHPSVASRALASITGKHVRAISQVRMSDAIAAAARVAWGNRSTGAALRRMAFVEAFEM